MHTSKERVSLDNLGLGAAIEIFNVELEKVLKGIVDPNPEPKKPREVILKVRFEPDDDRFLTDVDIVWHSKLSPTKTYNTKIIVDREAGKVEAHELVPAQKELFGDTDNDMVIPMEGRNGE